ncbi:MAG TPA: hypothetical protein VGC30_01525 [Dokdonella sp.]
MTPPDAARLAALARRLGVAPRLLPVLAGRVAADADSALDAARLRAELERLRAAGAAAEGAAALFRLGYAAYAIDDIDRALDAVWTDLRGGER